MWWIEPVYKRMEMKWLRWKQLDCGVGHEKGAHTVDVFLANYSIHWEQGPIPLLRCGTIAIIRLTDIASINENLLPTAQPIKPK